IMSTMLFMNCDVLRLLSKQEYLEREKERENTENSISLLSMKDVTFIKTMNLGTGDDILEDMAIDDDYIYLAGNDTQLSTTDSQMRLEKRYKSNGTLVYSFGNGGVIQFNYSSFTSYDNVEAFLHVELDDNYLYLGCRFYNSTNDRVWQIQKRNISNGALVNSFGTNGIIIINHSSGKDNMFAMASDEYYLYIAGDDYIPGNGQWHIEKRNKADGVLVTSFNDDGIYQNNYSTRNDSIFDLAIDENFIYAVGADGNNNGQWHINKINKFSGDHELSFGNNGIIIENFSNLDDRCWDIVIDNNYMYLDGIFHIDNSATSCWRIEKRNLNTGTLDENFGVNGYINEYLSEFSNNPLASTLNNENIYISGNDSIPGSDIDKEWRIEKRNILNGAFVSEFGINGLIRNNYSPKDDRCLAIITDNNHVFIAGTDMIQGNRQWRLEKRFLITGEY
ncbi:MAG: hypothetical protein JXB50_11130, partial [Spirochaetes bacterium]|nr:hypothetical protein [Spirochaetota bacterium]